MNLKYIYILINKNLSKAFFIVYCYAHLIQQIFIILTVLIASGLRNLPDPYDFGYNKDYDWSESILFLKVR
ncbi:protein of unknown function [Candidatus Nitrosocosmicus franklandus]|uniref:Uncharacterized protein n=1 Tax=Candidatus Nitrosocosmicus franklandianus TaxID=1798806 RepID=A0A484IFP9_9ARCH|nr:protein of unknown function [Candidatus Nitrosocosmicus franklandus]